MIFKFRLLLTVLLFIFLTVLLFKLMKVTLKITSLFHICYVNVLEKEKKLDLAYNDAGKFPVMIKKKDQNPYGNS